jgi:predicted phage replisome organizer
MPNGKDYVLFYLKLMVESIDHDGYLRFSETIPYNEEMLAAITNTNIDIVRSATKLLHQLGMIEVLSDQTIYLTEVKALMGSQTAGAERRQIQRQNQLERLQGGQKGDICHPEKEIELDIKRKVQKRESDDCRLATHTTKRFVKPTLEEVQNYCKERNNRVNAQRFIDYYESKGWTVGKNSPMKDWKACVRTWEQLDEQPQMPNGYDGRIYSQEDFDKVITDIRGLDVREI